MDSSFTPIEQMLKFRASRHEDFPYQEILFDPPLYAYAGQTPGKPQ
ncbi:transcriptional regulator [Salmonella enterica subsp. arizonae]|uniref:Transcriptional regulator n=1 Tax=Salmonella enterica subsp. arizonae TaxID=59203 RepID=A0A2X4T688_SALER|nr:transcriptional regulator [Salmonella enterica subsp. arizonae]